VKNFVTGWLVTHNNTYSNRKQKSLSHKLTAASVVAETVWRTKAMSGKLHPNVITGLENKCPKISAL
jgi:hypothetical protein